jgi:UDPglucose 6-dehydrogenase
MKIGIIGLGFVGSAINDSLKNKKLNIVTYDKFLNIGSLKLCLDTNILFLALPTPYDEKTKTYRINSIEETCSFLSEQSYKGAIIIKSTVVPHTTMNLSTKYENLFLIHNPEFLTARSAHVDFDNQSHIVLGTSQKSEKLIDVVNFYKKHYPNASISTCSSNESESMKIFCNSFYAMKVQIFNEFYLACNKLDCDYDIVKNMMLKNDWINPMHTDVPGPDGKLSYGGLCFPKDTNALNQFLQNLGSPNKVLSACIKERNIMRSDNNSILTSNKVISACIKDRNIMRSDNENIFTSN